MNNSAEVESEFWAARNFYTETFGLHCDSYLGPHDGRDEFVERMHKVIMELVQNNVCKDWTIEAVAMMVRRYNENNWAKRMAHGSRILDEEIRKYQETHEDHYVGADEVKRIYDLANAEIAAHFGDPVIKIESPLNDNKWLNRYTRKMVRHICEDCMSNGLHLNNHVENTEIR